MPFVLIHGGAVYFRSSCEFTAGAPSSKMADSALAALRAATCECAAAARRFNPEQSAEAAAPADVLRSFFSGSINTATPELQVQRSAPLLPQLPTELIVEVLQHLDVRNLGRLACTCRQLSFGPPCPPRPMSLVETVLRRRADEVGRWMPSSLPAGVSKWGPFLLQREWQSAIQLRTVSAGGGRSFFVDANGALLACGREEEGEVGLLGLREDSSQAPFTAMVPTPVPSVAGIRIRSVACHEDCNLAVSEAGQVFAWRRPVEPLPGEDLPWRDWQPPVPTVMEELRNHRVRQVAVGEFHSAALTEDGALFTWETRAPDDMEPEEPVPELGHGRILRDFAAPHRVLAFEKVRIASVALGTGFTVAVTEAGAGFSFGTGDGRLGHREGDENVGVFLPKRIEALHGIHVVAVAAGASHALALTRCGRVYTWGAEGPFSPVHGLGNDNDDLDSELHCVPQLITVLLGKRVQTIAAGPCMSCAVTDAGALFTWGRNRFGNLGHGDVCDRDWPKLVQGLRSVRVVGVSVCEFQAHAGAGRRWQSLRVRRGSGAGHQPGGRG
jgi:alpha-tubulin suppressor-like RCC1 family protein